MSQEAYQLTPQSLADLQRAELARRAARIAAIIERRTRELERIREQMDGPP